jgi:hypothetical protein
MSSVICIAFGENCAANVTVMILVVICAIRNLVAADFANVILDLAVLASCKSKTANVTLVISGINVSALRKSSAANVTLVIIVFVCAIRHFVVADVALVVIVRIYALGDSKTANVTLVVNGIYVSALRKSLAASVALVVVVAICANVMSCALIGTNVLCAFCICALTAHVANVLAFVRGFGSNRGISDFDRLYVKLQIVFAIV